MKKFWQIKTKKRNNIGTPIRYLNEISKFGAILKGKCEQDSIFFENSTSKKNEFSGANNKRQCDYVCSKLTMYRNADIVRNDRVNLCFDVIIPLIICISYFAYYFTNFNLAIATRTVISKQLKDLKLHHTNQASLAQS